MSLSDWTQITYWVGSESENPLRIMFAPDVAEDSLYTYLDGFDAKGMLVETFKLVDGEYTTSF